MSKVLIKLAEARKKVRKLYNNKKGYNYSYVEYSVIKDNIDPIINELNLMVVINNKTAHGGYKKEYDVSKDAEGNVLTERTVITSDYQLLNCIITDLESGETIELNYTYNLDFTFNNLAQSTGATLSYLRRYAYKMIFDLDYSDEDSDAKHLKNGGITKEALMKAYNKSKNKNKDAVAKEIKTKKFSNLTEERKNELLELLKE